MAPGYRVSSFCSTNLDTPTRRRKYTEAIKRNPKDHTVYTNRALCYLKMMRPKEAVDDCNKAIALDPQFARAYERRGNGFCMLKEMTRAYDDFTLAMEMDPANQAAKDGLQRVKMSVYGQRDEVVTQNAMKDPTVKAILSDPIINNVLKDLQTDPTGVQRALQNPDIASKIEKLMIAGVLGVGPGP